MNSKIKNRGIAIALIVTVIMMASCKKATLPGVTTGSVTLITQTDAYCSGQVISDGNAHITARGVCWDIAADPDLTKNKTRDSTGTGLFSSHITGLTPSTTYYVRAYATNSEGTSFGGTITFTTAPVGLPSLTTTGLKSVTSTTATGGGEITNDGGLPVTVRGVCWNTTGFPTIDDSHSTDGSGDGLFYSTLTDLTITTSYFVRAYATNSLGTSYGNQILFTQIEPVTDLDGNVYSVVTIGTQVWLGENLRTTTLNDGTPIPNVASGTDWANTSIPAYCWYNNDSPAFKTPYGALYNWYAAGTGRLCPVGWHVPSSDEYNTLINFLGGTNVAGGKLKESGTMHWNEPNLGATNGSSFTALPGGGRYNIYSDGGAFSDLGYFGYLWSSSESTNTDNAYSFDMSYLIGGAGRDEYSKRDGGSVRCIQDFN